MMGITYADIELIRAADLILVQEGYLTEDEVRQVQVTAQVNLRSSMLVISRALARSLDLQLTDRIQLERADGQVNWADVVGPVEVRFQNRRTSVGAAVLETETEVILGTIPLYGMDVMVDPEQAKLTINPKSPERARFFLKQTNRRVGTAHQPKTDAVKLT